MHRSWVACPDSTFFIENYLKAESDTNTVTMNDVTGLNTSDQDSLFYLITCDTCEKDLLPEQNCIVQASKEGLQALFQATTYCLIEEAAEKCEFVFFHAACGINPNNNSSCPRLVEQ